MINGTTEAKGIVMSHPTFEEQTVLHANICQALSDSKRILILYALDTHPRHVKDLAVELGLPQTTVSRHLRILRQQSLVSTKRTGAYVTYRLADQRIIQILDMMRQVMIDALKRKTAVFNKQRPLTAKNMKS